MHKHKFYWIIQISSFKLIIMTERDLKAKKYIMAWSINECDFLVFDDRLNQYLALKKIIFLLKKKPTNFIFHKTTYPLVNFIQITHNTDETPSKKIPTSNTKISHFDTLPSINIENPHIQQPKISKKPSHKHSRPPSLSTHTQNDNIYACNPYLERNDQHYS